MKTRSIATVVLLAFVGVSVAYLIIQESPSKPVSQSESGRMAIASPESGTPGEAESTSAQRNEQAGRKLIAYYFHRTQRCRTCLTIEAYAEEALKDAFPGALKTGELEWRALNVEESANEHFVGEYEITSSALVLVDTQNGEEQEWRNLERVWELVDDELTFKAYVETEALAFLGQDS